MSAVGPFFEIQEKCAYNSQNWTYYIFQKIGFLTLLKISGVGLLLRVAPI